MPTHCALKLVADLSFDPFERRTDSKNKEPGNAAKVADNAPPTLKGGIKITPEELARRHALAATGIYDNEERTEPSADPAFDNEADANVDPPDFSNPLGALSQTVKLINLLIDKVKVIGFSDAQQTAILDSLFYMVFWQNCVNEFRRAQIPTPAEVIRDRGVLFLHLDTLAPPLSPALKNLGFSEMDRFALRQHGNRKILGGGGGFTADPNKGSGLNHPALTVLFDSSFDGAYFSLDETMVHESIHRSGVTSDWAWWTYLGIPGHDLSGYDGYDRIIENCNRPQQ